jgi:DNA-binding MarR family transcriptional regulator
MAHTAFEHEPATSSRRIAIVADSPELQHILAPAVDRLGLSISADDDAARADVVLWARGPSDVLDALLDGVSGDRRLIIAIATEALDQWGFAVGVPGVELVPKTDHEGLVRAIARAPVRPTGRTRESLGDDPVQRLRELSAEVALIAQALSALGPGSGVADRRPPYRGEPGDTPPPSAPAIRAMIRARRTRDQYFAAELFADPAWDILLDLMAARLEGRDVGVSSLCIAAAVPPTTALRWISAMTEQGLLVRVADADDRRRVFIRLSTDAAERMEACLLALQRNAAPVA